MTSRPAETKTTVLRSERIFDFNGDCYLSSRKNTDEGDYTSRRAALNKVEHCKGQMGAALYDLGHRCNDDEQVQQSSTLWKNLTLAFAVTWLPIQQAFAQELIFEDPGKFMMVEGGSCGSTDEAESIVLEGSMPIPDDFVSGEAAVVLNGWRLGYTNDDQKVDRIRARIIEQRIVGNTLQWRVQGRLNDDSGGLASLPGFDPSGDGTGAIDDPYGFCYRYLAFAWDRENVHALPGDDASVTLRNDEGPPLSVSARVSESATIENPWSTPLFRDGTLHRPGREGGVAIVPHGFDFRWVFDGSLDGSDKKLLQFAYTRNAVAPVGELENGRISVGGRQWSWETSAIAKDEETRRYFQFQANGIALGGRDVQIIDPPFPIAPRGAENVGCITRGDDVSRHEIIIEDIPFDYAVPLLTGLELSYACARDENVLEVGAWIQNIQFDRDPETGLGRLRFDAFSQLTDNDSVPDHLSRHNISILGLRDGGPYRVIGPGGDIALSVP
ncbi:MAG: hypothetical protein KDI01_06475 [Halioglobus sp.]|nr:hypothetical protein [Halioglobus sp.]